MKWFMAAALSVFAFLAMARSVVAPVIIGPARLEYLFLAPSRIELLWLAAGAAALTLALGVWAMGIERKCYPVDFPRSEVDRGRSTGKHFAWMAPLCLLALSLAPLAAFIPGFARVGAPFVFIGHDMRWWVLAVSLALTARELDARLRRKASWTASWTPAARLLAWDAAVFGAVVIWALVSQPVMRFASEPHGDEPKYLRYAENWYQGNGFDLRPKERMSDMRLDAPSRVWRNAALAGGALAEEAWSLAGDVNAFAASPASFRWNRARGGDNWFLTGKQGGLYQVHTPGLSVLMFPGYYIDRHLLDLNAGHQGEVPGGLFMVNVTLLLLYALWAVATFRLLRRLLAHDAVAGGLAVLAMVTLPVTSFAFQLYPETAAGLALTLVLTFLLFPRNGGSLKRALAFGLICGFLPWAHIRFSLLSAVAVLYALLPHAGEWRQRRAFLGGYALMVALMCAYAYRLTGAPMPNAMFAAEGTADPFDASLIAPFLAGYMVDRIWGILPHVPLYLLAFLGLGPLWRSNRRHALLFAGLYLSLAIPSAAHSLNAAGATPGRHLVAVLPLAMWPLALALREWWGSRTFRAAFATLALLSLQAAFAYNWWHTKDTGRMWDVSISGWKVNLLFAWTHGDVWAASRGNFILFLVGALAIGTLFLTGWLARRRVAQAFGPAETAGSLDSEVSSPPRRVTASLVASGLLTTALAGASAIALTGDAFRDDYTQHPLVSRREALARLAELEGCVWCAASGRGKVSPATMTWNDVERFDVFVLPGANRAADLRIVVTAGDGEPGYGEVRIQYGDGSFSAETPVAGVRRLAHTYREPGRYMVRGFLTLPDGTSRETYTEVVIR